MKKVFLKAISLNYANNLSDLLLEINSQVRGSVMSIYQIRRYSIR